MKSIKCSVCYYYTSESYFCCSKQEEVNPYKERICPGFEPTDRGFLKEINSKLDILLEKLDETTT